MKNKKEVSKENNKNGIYIIQEQKWYLFKPTSDITLHELAKILDIKIGYLYYNKLPPSLQKHFKRERRHED